MPRRALSLPFSLFLIVAGLVLLYYMFYANRGHSDFTATWNGLGVVMRLVVIAGLTANAVGLGGILSSMLAPSRRR
jgi:hypothetical protein